MLRLHASYPGDDGERPKKPRSRWSALAGAAWDMGAVAGWLAVLLIGLVLLGSLVSGNFALRERLAPLIPAAVLRFFSEPAPPEKAGDRSKLGELRDKVWAEMAQNPQRGRARPRFTIGSSAEQVRAAQGAPNSQAGDTWHYGESEVYFVGGRVTGWRASNRNPLYTY